MCLGVEDPLIQVYFLMICEQQIQILERLAQEEGLHHVLGSCVQRVPHVADGGVAPTHLAILLNTLEYLPAPVLVFCFQRNNKDTTNSPQSPGAAGSGRRWASL